MLSCYTAFTNINFQDEPSFSSRQVVPRFLLHDLRISIITLSSHTLRDICPPGRDDASLCHSKRNSSSTTMHTRSEQQKTNSQGTNQASPAAQSSVDTADDVMVVKWILFDKNGNRAFTRLV